MHRVALHKTLDRSESLVRSMHQDNAAAALDKEQAERVAEHGTGAKAAPTKDIHTDILTAASDIQEKVASRSNLIAAKKMFDDEQAAHAEAEMLQQEADKVTSAQNLKDAKAHEEMERARRLAMGAAVDKVEEVLREDNRKKSLQAMDEEQAARVAAAGEQPSPVPHAAIVKDSFKN